MASISPLDSNDLYRRCDPDQFSFDTTAELADLADVIGQDRAVDAIRFGIGIEQPGYNLFALGPNGTGKYTLVHRSLEMKATGESVPSDWCYVYNFEHRHMPHALRLPAGQGVKLGRDMKRLVDELFVVIPGAFESEEYHSQKRTIDAEYHEMQEVSLEKIRQDAAQQDIALIRTPAGLAFAPLRDKEVIKPEDFMELPAEQRKQIESQISALQERLQKVFRQVPQWIRASRSRVKELNEEVTTFAITPLFDELKEKYSDLSSILDYLEAVRGDIVENNNVFVEPTDGATGADGQSSRPPVTGMVAQRSPETFANRYRVNVIVDHSQSEGAPVIYEQNPTYQSLIGRLEHISQLGALLTDFTLIKPGALHQANGGYLILDARNLLSQPYVWEGLKRALKSNEICIESPGQAYGLVSTASLQPEPIPFDIKIVLLGERQIYYLMFEYDPDFKELFKVTADFDDLMNRTDQNHLAYAQLVGTLARKEALRPFDRAAVARVIERSSRMVSDVEKLSADMQTVADLLREADYWAGQAGREIVSAEQVQQAIDAQVYRTSRIKERMEESILRETILIDTSGEKIGQINGLSVMMLGNYAFGRPSRITARVRMGRGEVIDIERQVELGGPLHSKGVLILSSFLGSRYAAERPLSLSASLVFEQSYGGVGGDSASSAELYALLSALAETPIKQSLAVTGSVNQHGQVQAIGGVNEKIEGFFDVCQARGLTGDQGVLIPGSNVKHLMLRRDIVEAVEKDQFQIYAVDSIEQGMELLTGIPAGELDDEGNYPEDSINQRVITRLESLTEKQQAFKEPSEEALESEDEA
jgi:lon-related putative ATP-dependent protease